MTRDEEIKMKELKMIEELEEIVKSRFKALKKRKRRVYSVSISSLLKEVFGVDIKQTYRYTKGAHLNNQTAKSLYLILRGNEDKDIAKIMGVSTQTIRNLNHKAYEILDVEDSRDFIGRVILHLLRESNILIIPTDEHIQKPLTLEEAVEAV